MKTRKGKLFWLCACPHFQYLCLQADPATQRILDHLCAAEAAAEKVLSLRAEQLQLDKQRQKSREASRALRDLQKKREEETEGRQERVWTCLANQFFALPTESVERLLADDSRDSEKALESVRSELKDAVNHLRDVEGERELSGFSLKALSSDDAQFLGI